MSDLQRTVEDILNRGELFAIIDINLEVYIGCMNNICWQGENDLGKSTKLFFYFNDRPRMCMEHMCISA